MPRLARIVVPGLPHHVTQRGNRRQQTFFTEADYRLYRTLVGGFAAAADVAVWSYCLMPNHVHLVLVPATPGGLVGALREAHRRYTRAVNARQGWTGYLWQGRFASYPMDGDHLLAAARYIELNPVRAGLVEAPEAWPWSSARAHLAGRRDGLCDPGPMLELVPDWRAFLEAGVEAEMGRRLERSQSTGRPLGSEAFIARIEKQTGRRLQPIKPGPKGMEGHGPHLRQALDLG